MKTAVLIIFTAGMLIFCLPGCKQKKSAFREESFLGEWYTIKGDVEAYSFLKDSNTYIFTGTQGMHPVVYGTWKIDKDKFIINTDNGTTTRYNFTMLNDTLIFNGGKEIYTRTTPLEVKYPEVRILKTLEGDFSSMNFSRPEPADVNLSYGVENTKSYQNFLLKGYSITTGIALTSDAVTEISNYLKEYGFEPDTIYATKNCYGFRDNDQIVTICTSRNPGSANDSIYIHITSVLIIK